MLINNVSQEFKLSLIDTLTEFILDEEPDLTVDYVRVIQIIVKNLKGLPIEEGDAKLVDYFIEEQLQAE